MSVREMAERNGGANGHQLANGVRPDPPSRLSEHPGGSENPHSR